METNNIIERIKTLCQDDHIKHNLQRFLDLAILVDKNYEHIEQLETLIRLFEGGLSDYYKEYHSAQNELAEIIGMVCNNTRGNHYKKEDEIVYPSIYDVQIELFGKENKIVSYKQLSYAK
jgi:iron-sulfur cluster repair protein YtfE (RIC family)